LECIRNDRQDQGGSKARTLRDYDRVASHGNLMLSHLCSICSFWTRATLQQESNPEFKLIPAAQ
jgi:hypothetical protein